MTIEATVGSPLAPNATSRPLIHPVWVRVTHWINALAMLVMIGSGWQIYDAAPLFGFTFGSLSLFGVAFLRQLELGNWLAGALLWHFAAMWILMINGLVYLILGILSGRFRRKLFPIYPGEVFRDLFAALRGKLAHDDLSVYNAVQKLLYLGIIVAGITIVLSGLSIWKPVQFHPLTSFFGGYNTARYVHFAAMTTIVAFLIVHVSLAILVPKSLRAMIIGR